MSVLSQPLRYCTPIVLMAWVPVTHARQAALGLLRGVCVHRKASSRGSLSRVAVSFGKLISWQGFGACKREVFGNLQGHGAFSLMQTLGGLVHLCLITGIPPNCLVGYNVRKPLFLSNTDKHLFRSPVCPRTTKFNSRKYRSRERLKSFIKLKSSFPQ